MMDSSGGDREYLRETIQKANGAGFGLTAPAVYEEEG